MFTITIDVLKNGFFYIEYVKNLKDNWVLYKETPTIRYYYSMKDVNEIIYMEIEKQHMNYQLRFKYESNNNSLHILLIRVLQTLKDISLYLNYVQAKKAKARIRIDFSKYNTHHVYNNILNNISVSKTIYDESLWFVVGEEAELFNHIVYESINVNDDVNKALDKILGYIGFNKRPQIISETC